MDRVTLILGVLVGIAGLAVDAAGQASSPSSNVRALGDREARAGEPPPFSGTTVYVSPEGSDTNPGTQSSRAQTIQRGVMLANQAHAAGKASRVLIAAGIYRESVDLGGQKTDAALIIEGAGSNTILTGADPWTAWVRSLDGSLTHHWPYKWGMKAIPNGWGDYWTSGGNGYKRDALRRSEMVYVNGQPQRAVMSLPALVAGTFYVDRAPSCCTCASPLDCR